MTNIVLSWENIYKNKVFYSSCKVKDGRSQLAKVAGTLYYVWK